MKIPEKYQSFLAKGATVEINEQEKTVKFTFDNGDYDQVQQFLLVLDQADFKGYEVVLYIWGKCQNLSCQEIWGAESSGETLQKNINKAKEVQTKGGVFLVHVCAYCLFEAIGQLGFDEQTCRV